MSRVGGVTIDAAYILQIDVKMIVAAHILQIDDGISGMSFVCLNTRVCACWYRLARNARVYMPIGFVLKGFRRR